LGALARAREELASTFADHPKIIRVLFALDDRIGFALCDGIVSDKVFKSFRFNLLPMSGI
jgi:hypothetical protein